jgi:hypothetical protein
MHRSLYWATLGSAPANKQSKTMLKTSKLVGMPVTPRTAPVYAWFACEKRRRQTLTSRMGQKQTFAVQNVVSALPPKADMCSALGNVC